MAPDSFYEELIAFARKYDIIVLHDNAYSDLIFDGKACGSFLRFPGAKEIGVEFNSLSKTYGLAGARIGFCLGNSQVVSRLKLLKSNMDYGMFLPIQAAAIAAITGDQSCVQVTRQAYETRRNIMCDGFTSIGWKMERPEALCLCGPLFRNIIPAQRHLSWTDRAGRSNGYPRQRVWSVRRGICAPGSGPG